MIKYKPVDYTVVWANTKKTYKNYTQVKTEKAGVKLCTDLF